MKTPSALASLFLLIALLFVPGSSHAQTAFTYQGQLRDGSTNANGTYALTFALFDAPGGGSQVGSTLAAPSLSIVSGLFTVNLDFGGAAFDGNPRWLQITVGADVLAPRVAVLPAPYALFAAVAGTVTNRAITTALIADGAVTNRNLAANAVTTAKISDDAVTTTKILDGAVTDAKIASVSGSKVSGAVASAIFASSATTAGTATLANSVADGSIATASLQNGAVTSAKIASGQVVKSLNGLTDAVTFSAGQNVTLTPTGNDIQISTTNISSAIVGASTNLKAVVGVVDATGSVLGGSGFTSSYSPGRYNINFTQSFSGTPVIVVSPMYNGNSSNSASYLSVDNQNASSFNVITTTVVNNGVSGVNTVKQLPFQFIAIGTK